VGSLIIFMLKYIIQHSVVFSEPALLPGPVAASAGLPDFAVIVARNAVRGRIQGPAVPVRRVPAKSVPE